MSIVIDGTSMVLQPAPGLGVKGDFVDYGVHQSEGLKSSEESTSHALFLCGQSFAVAARDTWNLVVSSGLDEVLQKDALLRTARSLCMGAGAVACLVS
jgi:hypothetical protein